jgi:branched-chain amino acid transport system ATP-binding protein
MSSETPQPALLCCAGVGKRFAGFTALQGIDLEVSAREIVGIIGPNGAGKTTLFNVIAGVFAPTAGRISFDGRDITRLPTYRRTRRGIGRTFQLISPFPSMTVFENVHTAAQANGFRAGEARKVAEDAIDRLQLSEIAWQSAGDINAVEGKRLEVARALATRPKLILLDEIFTGLNADEVEYLVHTVNQLRSDGLGVLIIEHNVSAIRAVADRVIAIDAGKAICEGSPESVFQNQQVMESYLGTHAAA